MSIYTLIPIVFIALYLGYWFYIKNKNSQQAQIVISKQNLQMPRSIKTTS